MLIVEFLGKPQTLFASRRLLNVDEVREWAKEQGFTTILTGDDMHVTVAFSKEKFAWGDIDPISRRLVIKGGERSIEQFGDATVLCFASKKLHDRWEQFGEAGASYDFPTYRPHVTISYNGENLDLEGMRPFTGDLIFGPEELKEINDDWADNVEEDDL